VNDRELISWFEMGNDCILALKRVRLEKECVDDNDAHRRACGFQLAPHLGCGAAGASRHRGMVGVIALTLGPHWQQSRDSCLLCSRLCRRHPRRRARSRISVIVLRSAAWLSCRCMLAHSRVSPPGKRMPSTGTSRNAGGTSESISGLDGSSSSVETWQSKAF